MEAAVPATTGNSGDDGTSADSHQQPPPQTHENGVGGGAFELGDRNSTGNRWPKQETLALIKIRSEMDSVFRDSSLKGPLWDNVSRKLAELGFHRSAKKCREKFENVSKYHRRTKDHRTSKSDKIYRFSDQLQALESNPNATMRSDQNNVSPISVAAPAVMSSPPLPPPPPPVINHKRTFPFSQPNMSDSASSSSSDTSSETESLRKKKKWEDFFGKLMKEVISKQEELQMRFLETLEKRERDRVAREEAWRAREITEMNREYERLVMEKSVVAAKDAAVVAFLEKMTGKDTEEARKKLTDLMTTPPLQLQPQPQPQSENGVSTSRWPKAEINALITLRTQLDIKYHETAPKGPLWEEISAEMKNIGYNRNAKRCKEKWENINKYYKKMKYGNKKRSLDSKTCPYFDQLDAIYRNKSSPPIVAQPEQQWRAPPPPQQTDIEYDDNEDDGCYDEEDEDGEDGGGYEIEDSKISASMAAV